MALEMMLAGLGEAAAHDVASVQRALPTASGGAVAAAVSNKFMVHANQQAKVAQRAAIAMQTATAKPPTNATAAQAAAAHDAFVAAATASGRLSVAGNLLGQASQMHAAAAAAAVNTRVQGAPPAPPVPPPAALPAMNAVAAGAAAAVSAPAGTGVKVAPGPFMQAIAQSAAPLATAASMAAPVQPPGTVPASGAGYAPIAAHPTAQPLPNFPSKFQVPPGMQAQPFLRTAGIGTAIPAGLAPTKGGGRMPLPAFKGIMSKAQGYAAWTHAPNPGFYGQNKMGAPIGTVAAFRGGGLSGLGGFEGFEGFGQTSPVSASANRIAQNTIASVSKSAQVATARSLAGLGDGASDDQAIAQVALDFLKNKAHQSGTLVGTWIGDVKNNRRAVEVQRAEDAARFVVQVNPTAMTAGSWAGPILPGNPAYGKYPYDQGSAPSFTQQTVAAASMATAAPSAAPTHGGSSSASWVPPSGASSAGSGSSGSSSTPTAAKGLWAGLSTGKKVGVGAGGALAVILGLKFLL